MLLRCLSDHAHRYVRLSEHQKQSLEWAHRLTGIEPQILLDARAQIVAMHAPNVVRELATDWFLDDLVGAYLLVRALDHLAVNRP